MQKHFTLLWLLAYVLLLPKAQAAGPVAAAQSANIVIHSESTLFRVNSISSGTTVYTVRLTILNEHGNHRAKLPVYYNKLTKVERLEGTSYDAAGKKIKALKSKDILDINAVDDGSLFTDHRVKIANLQHTVYPYTVEFSYELTNQNMLFYPSFVPQDEERLEVEKAAFEVQVPKGVPLRYFEANMPATVAKAASATHDTYTWRVQDLKPVETEPYGPELLELVPQVRTAPTDFEVEGYRGNMESWESFGRWIHQLNQGRDVLPEETKQRLVALTASAKTEEEKVRMVYDYLQGKTRYVSIQLGIGGWQPFEANFVDSKGYGDCKALTNYTQAMLKAVGINSYHALIRAGDDAAAIKADFPSSQFNHDILCVPMAQDTLWLECTSQIEAAGYSGSFTGGRHALLITPEGGKLVKTTTYKAPDNAQIRHIRVQLDEKGNGNASVSTRYTGLQQESRHQAIHSLKPEEQRNWLYKQVKIPAFEIRSFTMEQRKDRLPAVHEQLELSLRQCATISGKRMFLTPNLMNRWTYAPSQKAERLTEVVRDMAFLDADTVEFELPLGYALEFLPGEVVHKTQFGEYRASVQVKGQHVIYRRSLQMAKGRYSPDSYAKMVEFMNNIIKADAQQVVFVKNIP